jgi:hypothetical protein
LVRGLDGKEYKPEDYLAAFARFVKENPAHVDAIEILLDIVPKGGEQKHWANYGRS